MSFLAPWGLLLGLGAIPLVALYFLKIRRQRIAVPSILLWQVLQKTERLASPFERFRRNLLLLLQLLLLLLLALALARPYRAANVAPERSVVVVIDTSASMNARDGSPTRIDDAIAKAKQAIDALGSSDEAMLVLAGAKTDVRVPFTRDLGTVRAALAGVKATEAEGSLRDGLELALSLSRSRPGVEVLVFSDGGGDDLSTVPVGAAKVKYVPTGTGADNAGIVALDLRRSPVSDLDRQLFVTAADFSGRPLAATVQVYLDDKLVGQRTETLDKDTPDSLVFDLPPNAAGHLKVTLDAPGDLMPTDDVAWAVVTPVASRKVLLVGVDGLSSRALSADRGLDLSAISPQGFQTAMFDQYDAVLFGGDVPDGAKGHRYAVLGPYKGGPAKFGAEVKSPDVLGWRRTHPVMRFVEWEGVSIARARKVDDAGVLLPLVDGSDGPLVLAGEDSGARVLELSFNPLESDLPLRVAWPVLLLNTVDWITEGGGDDQPSRLVATGTPFVRRLPTGTSTDDVRITGPAGRVSAEVTDGLLRVTDTTNVGIYTVDAGTLHTEFAADLLSPRESNILPRTSLALADAKAEASANGLEGRQELWRPLLLVALGMMSVEWLAWNRRRAA